MKSNRFRIVSLLLAVGIAAGLFGCGNQGKESGHKAAEEKDAVLSGQKDGSEDSKGSGQNPLFLLFPPDKKVTAPSFLSPDHI